MSGVQRGRRGAIAATRRRAVPAGPYAAPILWGVGEGYSGAWDWSLRPTTDYRMLGQWAMDPGSMEEGGWVRGYQPGMNSFYAAGYAAQVVIWIADWPDYAISAQFRTDLAGLITALRGDGPNYGPMYVVMFSELETHPGADEDYFAALRSQYLQCIPIIKNANPLAKVGLGFGGYDWNWDDINGPYRDLTEWDHCIRESDFACAQQMHSCENYTGPGGQQRLISQMRLATEQLGWYGLPVMVSHFEIWGEQPCPQNSFENFLDEMTTDASLQQLTGWGLWAWQMMLKGYISVPSEAQTHWQQVVNHHRTLNTGMPADGALVTRVRAGSSTPYTDSQGKVWAAEAGFTGGTGGTATSRPIANTTDDTLYLSSRWGMSSWSCTVPQANKPYIVRIPCAETSFTGSGQRVFTITGPNRAVISNVDLFDRVGANRAYTIAARVVPSTTTLTLTFSQSADVAEVCGIEVTAGY